MPENDIPSDFNKPILTDAGRKLLLEVGGGKDKLDYTRAVLYSQDVNGLDDDAVRALTTLNGDLLETNIDIKDIGKNYVILNAVFSNDSLDHDISYNSIGWYGKKDKDSTDTLMSITPATSPRTFVAGSTNKQSTAHLSATLINSLSDGTVVNLTINQAGTVNQSDMSNAISLATSQLERKVVESATVNGGDKVYPDASHNLALTIPQPDLSPYATKDELKRYGDAQDWPVSVTDVRQMMTRGNYHFNNLTDAQFTGLKNKPDSDKWAVLTVLPQSTSNGVQTWRDTNSSGVYVENWSSGGTNWTAWDRLNNTTTYTNDQIDAKINGFDLTKIKFRKQADSGNFTPVDKTWSAKKQDDGSYTIDLYSDDWTAADLAALSNRLASGYYTKKEIDGQVNTLNGSIQDVRNALDGETSLALDASNGTFVTSQTRKSSGSTVTASTSAVDLLNQIKRQNDSNTSNVSAVKNETDSNSRSITDNTNQIKANKAVTDSQYQDLSNKYTQVINTMTLYKEFDTDAEANAWIAQGKQTNPGQLRIAGVNKG